MTKDVDWLKIMGFIFLVPSFGNTPTKWLKLNDFFTILFLVHDLSSRASSISQMELFWRHVFDP